MTFSQTCATSAAHGRGTKSGGAASDNETRILQIYFLSLLTKMEMLHTTRGTTLRYSPSFAVRSWPGVRLKNFR
ncbi:hypothetical protein PTE30175_02170 [Pandoraea terrae]|uniref:Uncharacterized protein n=1 Tax=Pandoraea terrae TaxID=1537710 RepID=A0A5E4UT22_9BURK|nr:hypothetical protein PTE30175_02170 [Pandoraea terrae]